MLTIAVLGEVEATRGGVRLPLPSGKTTDLLVRLAVQPGAPVRVDTLIEDLWGVPVDRNTLQEKVSQLRRALGGKDVVVARGDAYLLDVPAEQIDATAAAVERPIPGRVCRTWARRGNTPPCSSTTCCAHRCRLRARL